MECRQQIVQSGLLFNPTLCSSATDGVLQKNHTHNTHPSKHKTAIIFPELIVILSIISILPPHNHYYLSLHCRMSQRIFKNTEELMEFQKENDKVLVIKDGYVLDCTSFARYHPGGAGLILTYKNRDISEAFKGHYQLSYKVADSLVVGGFEKEMAKILDFDKPLMTQVWNMTHEEYVELVKSPHWMFVTTPKMFESDFMELMSRNPWYHIVLFNIFLYTWWLYTLDYSNIYFITALPVFILGMIFHTFLQYSLHRWVFHAEDFMMDNKILRYIHFMLHGVHHMIPMDPNRLVLPPQVAILFLILGYYTIYPLIFPSNYELKIIFFTGQTVCYLLYDLTHFCLHHLRFQKGYLRRLQQYHNQHHYSGEAAGYGVSSKLWDIVFRTELKKEMQRS